MLKKNGKPEVFEAFGCLVDPHLYLGSSLVDSEDNLLVGWHPLNLHFERGDSNEQVSHHPDASEHMMWHPTPFLL